jgi:integrase
MPDLPPLEALLLQARELDPGVLAQIQARALYAYAEQTIQGLVSPYKDYRDWCAEHNRSPVPASIETVLLYYDERSQLLGPQAIRQRRKIITLLHRYYDEPSPNDHPLVRTYLRARLRDAEPTKQKAAFSSDEIRAMVRIAETIKAPFRRARDIALLTFLFGSAARAGEVAATCASEVTPFPAHLAWFIPRSKTDQYNQGYTVFIGRASDARFCPLETMRAWREHYNGTSLFCQVTRCGTLHTDGLSSWGIRRVIKHYATAIGLNASDYAGHSMRSGFVTSGYAAGVSEDDMRAITRQSVNTLRKYNRETTVSRYNLTRALGF